LVFDDWHIRFVYGNRVVKDAIIIGGGMAGLISSILLKSSGFEVTLFEKKSYPFHRVCGEYISNEVIPFLKRIGCYPEELEPSIISHFKLTAPNGNSAEMKLDLGGFGISRYSFDQWLVKKAINAGVEVLTETPIKSIDYNENHFQVSGSDFTASSRIVIGAFGKRSILDNLLHRPSFKKRSPYIGVKYHCSFDNNDHEIALHNFEGGYCGVLTVENQTVNVCYLMERKLIKKYGSIHEVERSVIQKNPHLNDLFRNAEFHWDQPQVINEISFARKELIYNHVLMAGDAAGMVTPLSGNGMALAIHSAKIVTEEINKFLHGQVSRKDLELNYEKKWKDSFNKRLWFGRQIQSLFGNPRLSNVAVQIVKNIPLVSTFLMQRTHGKLIQ